MDEGYTDDHNYGHNDGGPVREATYPQLYKRYGSYSLRPYVTEPLPRISCQKCPRPAGPMSSPSGTAPEDMHPNSTRTTKTSTANRGTPPPVRSAKRNWKPRLNKDSHTPKTKILNTRHVNRKPSPIPLTNTWATLTVYEMGKRPFSWSPSTLQTTTCEEPMEVSTKQPKPTASNSIPKILCRTGIRNR